MFVMRGVLLLLRGEEKLKIGDRSRRGVLGWGYTMWWLAGRSQTKAALVIHV
jgi:hypothetical protein